MKQMQVWDTAGQERFRTITQSYYRSAHGAIIAYDITRHPTFDSVTHWIKEVELYGASNVLLVLIGQFSSCTPELDTLNDIKSGTKRRKPQTHFYLLRPFSLSAHREQMRPGRGTSGPV